MKKCCDIGSTHICGGPGMWDLGGNEPAIRYCPWCGVKLPETNIMRFDVVVRYDRGLGNEFRTFSVEAESFADAKAKGEKEADDQLAGSKYKLLGSQATPIKGA